jgi:polyisoprenoid-binding protein YceI
MARIARFIAFVALMGAVLGASPALADIKPPNTDPAAAPAGDYVLDKRHASVIAKVSHMGLSGYTMRFDRLDGHFAFDPAQPDAAKISVTIDANSLDVGESVLNHQFAREFLGADADPQISFTSTGIQRTDANHGTVTGDLTFHGVTRPVTLTVTFNGYESSLIGGRRMGFSAAADFLRSDFGSKAWLSLVGDQVHLLIEAEFTLE